MSERRWLAIIISLYVTLALGYGVMMPPWEGPDEPAHYILAVNLARVGIFSSIERNYEAGQPQTYYRLASIPLKWLHKKNRDWVAVIRPEADFGNVRKPAPIYQWSDENYQFLPGLYLLRGLSILLGLGTLGLNYAATRMFFEAGERTIPLSALALAALTPQFLHTQSSVANDPLGILAGAFLFWLALKIALEEVHPSWYALAIITAFLLTYGTKLTVLPVGLAAVLGVIIHARARWPRQWPWLVAGGVALGLVSVLILAFTIPEMGALFLRQLQFRAFYVREDALSWKNIWEMISQVVWSFWGKVGWLAVGLPGWVVVGLTGLGVVGVGVEVKRKIWDGEKENRGGWGIIWLVAGLTIAAVMKNGLNTTNTQGRFLFPAIGALAVLMISGWNRLLPTRFQPYLLPGVIGLMLGANLVLWFWGILPVYYQPFLD